MTARRTSWFREGFLLAGWAGVVSAYAAHVGEWWFSGFHAAMAVVVLIVMAACRLTPGGER